ncbi:uncharacterized protein LOC129948542 [Eupeodes corollae]|uniref:uncharacterized protein LOC129948542 n=1 Tax=Eupeodes corollae TaxID=290404 RepID=UPI0024927568|nr:uncharacterized protein LOC129948542 [Eupeodes corollae]
MSNEYIESEKIWRRPSIKLDYRTNIGIGQAILEKLKHTDPQKVLEVEHESGASLTAGQVRQQTIAVAQNLMRLGVKKGDIVIVFSKTNLKITPITFALYTIGAPINFFYLDLKGDDIKFYFEKLNPKAIIYEEEFKNDVFQALENLKLSNLKHVLSLDSKTESVEDVLFKPLDDIENFQPPDIGDPNELIALLPFTSGSTGRPKIAMHSHSMVLLGVYNRWWHMDPQSVVCVLSDLRWMCQVEMMMQPVFFDVKRIYTSKCEKDFDDTYEYELLFQNKVTHFSTVSILLLHTLQNAHKSNNTSKLSHLKIVLLGGEVVTDSLIEYAAQIMPQCKIITCYGMTEMHGIIASDEDLNVTGRIVNGGILANEYILKVIDENGKHLGPNEKGRLCLKSKVPIMGYFKNDAANKEHLSEDGWFTTEEYGYMDSDNLLNVVIRYKYLLRYKGQFVVPTDIENIVNSHPNVLISALVGYPDPENEDSEIGTMFVLRNEAKSDDIEDEVLGLLRKNLTTEQARFVRFLKLVDKVPMCNYSKVNRTALKEMAATESVNYTRKLCPATRNMGNHFVENEKVWYSQSCEIDVPNLSLGQAILAKLKETKPNRILEIEHESRATLTAAEIRSQTITVTQNLLRLGVKKGDIVIVFSKSNIKITPITFALYTIGAPVNFFYLDLKGDDIKFYFEILDPTVILYEEEFKNEVFSTIESLELHKLKHILSLDSKSTKSSVDEVLFKNLGDIENFQPPNIGDPCKLPAVLPFTSGSTGLPKIVMQSHAMILQSVYNKWWHMDSNSVVCVLSDLRWMDQVGMMLQQVFFNVKRVYTSKCEKDFDDAYELELLHQNQVTHFFTIPILILNTLRNAVKLKTISKLSYLRTILIGGEAVTDSLVKYIERIMPACKVIISYGMTELDVKIASDEEISGKMVNGGILANGYTAKIIDEQGNSLGPNEKGRLCLKSTVPVLGYFKNDAANREHFSQDGWFRTEEYSYMNSEHLLNVVMRFRYLLRFNGQFVNPTDVENIINDHPSVRISALVGYPDPLNSRSEIGVIFVVIGSKTNRHNIQIELKALLKHRFTNQLDNLIRYLEIIDKMPLLNYCKINRAALSEMAARFSKSYISL